MKLAKLVLVFLAVCFSFTALMPPTAMASPMSAEECAIVDPDLKLPKFNECQRVFSLASFVSLNRDCDGEPCTGTVEALEDRLTEAIQQQFDDPYIRDLIGYWTIGWGPVIYQKEPGEVGDNTMFVAKQGNNYVISIAGTAPDSWYNWLCQNLYVGKTVDWPFFPGDAMFDPAISKGTGIGLLVLNQMTSEGNTIQEYLRAELQNAPSAEVNVFVTGFSLGGALSPTLALQLADTQDNWDPYGKATIYTYAFAGPTAGNADFADYSDYEIGANMTRIWNTYDIVTHAWNESMLNQIPTLFEDVGINGGRLVDGLVWLLKEISHVTDYTQINQETPGLPGVLLTEEELSGYCLPSDFKNSEEQQLCLFFAEAMIQHSLEYFDILNVQELFGPQGENTFFARTAITKEKVKEAVNVCNPNNLILQLK